MYEPLASDKLEKKEGPTEIEVMFQDENSRIICTRSVGDRSVLEVSLVIFAPDAAESFPDVFEAMKNGESMGKAFRSRGIEFHRQINSGSTCDLPPAFERWFGNAKGATVIDLVAAVGPDRKPFAKILETYRSGIWPQFTGELTPDNLEQINRIAEFLKDRPKAI